MRLAAEEIKFSLNVSETTAAVTLKALFFMGNLLSCIVKLMQRTLLITLGESIEA